MSNIIIRPAKFEDVPEFLKIYAPYVLGTTYSFEYTVPTLDAFIQRFKDITSFYPWYAAELDGRIVGYAYGSRMFERAAYMWSADMSIYIAKAAHGLGIGSRLYRAVEDDLTEMGCFNAYAIITEENLGSRAFHEKAGYTLECKMEHTGYKHGRWLGVYWYVKRLRSGEPDSPPHKWLKMSV